MYIVWNFWRHFISVLYFKQSRDVYCLKEKYVSNIPILNLIIRPFTRFTNVCYAENFDAEYRYVIIIDSTYHTHFQIFEASTILRMSKEYDENKRKNHIYIHSKIKSFLWAMLQKSIMCMKQFRFMNVLRLTNGFKNTFPAKVSEIGRYSFNTTTVFS